MLAIVEFTVSFGRLMKLAAPEKWLIVGATVGLIVSSIAVLALPFFGGQIVDTGMVCPREMETKFLRRGC